MEQVWVQVWVLHAPRNAELRGSSRGNLQHRRQRQRILSAAAVPELPGEGCGRFGLFPLFFSPGAGSSPFCAWASAR
jgi:hypothetical protein